MMSIFTYSDLVADHDCDRQEGVVDLFRLPRSGHAIPAQRRGGTHAVGAQHAAPLRLRPYDVGATEALCRDGLAASGQA